ncbi:hypothetical protein R6Q57_002427 [Mikania cordata]
MQPTNEADRLLQIAEKLLKEKDLNAARDFALLAQETEPLLDGSDQITAIADVLIAGDKRINDIHHHCSSVAWSVLSDPETKAAYDNELFEFFNVDLDAVKNQREKDVQNHREKMLVRRNFGNKRSSESLWTLCPYCYHLYEYPRAFEGCCLRCEKCDRAFQVVEITTEALPPALPGREAYCSSWPYFPIGFTMSVSDRLPPERYSTLGDLLPNVSAVDGTPSESRSTMQPPENTAPDGV